MELHLTRDEADRLETDGQVVLFRAGMNVALLAHRGGEVTAAPAEFVEAAQPCGNKYHAFYLHDVGDNGCPDCLGGKRRIAAVVPCPTCGGAVYMLGSPDPSDPDPDCAAGLPCPDCLDGKRRIAVAVPCPLCEGENTKGHFCTDFHEHCHDPRCIVDPDEPCGNCNDGLVTVGHVVVTFGPLVVVEWSDRHDNCIVLMDGALWVWRDHSFPDGVLREIKNLPPDIDPRSLVGQYALGVRKVDL